MKVIPIIIAILIGFVAWQFYYYGYRLESMCDEAQSKELSELKALIEGYGFNPKEIKDEKNPQEWYVIVRPHLMAVCFIKYDRRSVISTEFLWD